MTQTEFDARLAVIRDRAIQTRVRLDTDSTPSNNTVAEVIDQLDEIAKNVNALQGVTIQP